MARSALSNIAASVADGRLSLSIFRRRGYAAAAANGAVSASFGSGSGRGGSTAGNGMIGKVDERAVIKEDSGAWAPDPITGYYRPANGAAEIDPAGLREMLLNRRVRPH